MLPPLIGFARFPKSDDASRTGSQPLLRAPLGGSSSTPWLWQRFIGSPGTRGGRQPRQPPSLTRSWTASPTVKAEREGLAASLLSPAARRPALSPLPVFFVDLGESFVRPLPSHLHHILAPCAGLKAFCPQQGVLCRGSFRIPQVVGQARRSRWFRPPCNERGNGREGAVSSPFILQRPLAA